MSYFRYKVLRTDGRVMSGVVQLPFVTIDGARHYFERRGSTVIAVRQVGELVSQLVEFGELRSGRRITRDDLIEFLSNLSTMLRSGIPIMTALTETVALSENRALIRTIEQMHLAIEAGLGFADALDQHPRVFSDSVRHLARIGEETGRLDRTLKDAAEHLERLRQIRTDTSRSMIYPMFVFAVTLGAALFWIFYVIPGIEQLFVQMQLKLPPLTVWMLDATDFIHRHAAWIGAVIAAIVLVAVISIRNNRKARHAWHRLLLRLPVVGRITQASGLAFIAEYFSLFASSGIDIMKSLTTLEGAVSNEVYREKLAGVRAGLERGGSLSEEFKRAGVFPSFVIRMLSIGEQTGNLAEQLHYIADEYRRRLNNIVNNIGEIIKPVAMLIVGGFFVLIVVGLFLPVYQLIGQINIARF